MKSTTAKLKPADFALPSLSYLTLLTTRMGIVQHARFSVPDLRHGYCLDDNGRALALVVRYMNNAPEKRSELRLLAAAYLSYINLAQREDGWMHNFMSYNHHFLDEVGSEDSFGRAMWGLGECAADCPDEDLRSAAKDFFTYSMSRILELQYIRSISYSICGLAPFVQKYPEETQSVEMLKTLVKKMMTWYQANHKPNWDWFEDRLTYSNAIIPLALHLAGQVLDDQKALTIARTTADWLLAQTEQQDDKTGVTVAMPIGTNGWYIRGRTPALFDQQPVDPALTVLLSAALANTYPDAGYEEHLLRWIHWFEGHNILNLPVVDESNGSCFDGLHESRVNQNKGAESTVLYLLARIEAYQFTHQHSKI